MRYEIWSQELFAQVSLEPQSSLVYVEFLDPFNTLTGSRINVSVICFKENRNVLKNVPL
jgi:hypothetical protein